MSKTEKHPKRLPPHIVEPEGYRYCLDCEQMKSFAEVVVKKRKKGLEYARLCKSCFNARSRANYSERSEEILSRRNKKLVNDRTRQVRERTKKKNIEKGIDLSGTLTCRICKSVKYKTEFTRDITKRLGVKSVCKECGTQEKREKYHKDVKASRSKHRRYYEANKSRLKPLFRFRNALRREVQRDSTPGWADKAAMRVFYDHADLMTKITGEVYHVDHIDPLRHDLVCGLHVPSNLRVVKASVNLVKNNNFSPYRVISDGFTTDLGRKIRSRKNIVYEDYLAAIAQPA